MIATTVLGFITVLFAFLAKYKNIRWGLEFSFLLIFLFLALRYNFGNDYKAYFESFIEINRYASLDIFDKTNQFEPAWILLNRLFKPLGFFPMVALLSGFHCFVFYRFIKKNVPANYYWLAVFLYVFNTTFLLILSSAMRQSVAVTLFIIAIDYIYKRKIVPYLLLIGLASLFHTSALFLIPFYFLGYVNWRITLPYALIIVSIFTSFFLAQEFLSEQINSIVQTYFKKYEVYEGGSQLASGFGMLFYIMMFIITILYAKYFSKKSSLLFKLAIISFMFIPLGFIITLIGRVGFYFAPATIISYPLIFSSTKRPLFMYGLGFLMIFMTLYSYFTFFQSDMWQDAFGTYQTILSAPIY